MFRRRYTPLFNKDDGGDIPGWGKDLQSQIANLTKSLETKDKDKDKPPKEDQSQQQPETIPAPKPPVSETSESSETTTEEKPKRRFLDFLL